MLCGSSAVAEEDEDEDEEAAAAACCCDGFSGITGCTPSTASQCNDSSGASGHLGSAALASCTSDTISPSDDAEDDDETNWRWSIRPYSGSKLFSSSAWLMSSTVSLADDILPRRENLCACWMILRNCSSTTGKNVLMTVGRSAGRLFRFAISCSQASLRVDMIPARGVNQWARGRPKRPSRPRAGIFLLFSFLPAYAAINRCEESFS